MPCVEHEDEDVEASVFDGVSPEDRCARMCSPNIEACKHAYLYGYKIGRKRERER